MQHLSASDISALHFVQRTFEKALRLLKQVSSVGNANRTSRIPAGILAELEGPVRHLRRDSKGTNQLSKGTTEKEAKHQELSRLEVQQEGLAGSALTEMYHCKGLTGAPPPEH